VNLPGVPPERFPAWRRRMSLPVERLGDSPEVARAVEGASARARRR